jgi:hypothetical protein
MYHRDRFLSALVISFALAAPAVVTGCATHRVYDPAYNDYHAWNSQESGIYVRWESDTHREHREFNRRPADEQKVYWTYRHGQSNGGHDNDR